MNRVIKLTPYHDKKGIVIREGDLIRNYQTGDAPNPPGEVFFDYGEWCYDCYHAGALPLKTICDDSVVVGNIRT